MRTTTPRLPSVICLPLVLLALASAFLHPSALAAPSPTPTPSPTATPNSTTTLVTLDPVNPATLSQVPPATTGTITMDLSTLAIVTITPTGACTFNSTGTTTRIGKECTFVVTTSGTTSRILTWGTNFKTTGTLATGTTTAKTFTVTFKCLDGTQWLEIARSGPL